MGLMDIARADMRRIVTDLNEWAVTMTFTSPDNSQTKIVKGTHTKHHLGLNGETGQIVNTKKATIAVPESEFGDYVVRNSSQEVALIGHYVVVKDSTGIDKNYVVRETYPDESLGLIVCILGDFQ